jgi:hypothetical protein
MQQTFWDGIWMSRSRAIELEFEFGCVFGGISHWLKILPDGTPHLYPVCGLLAWIPRIYIAACQYMGFDFEIDEIVNLEEVRGVTGAEEAA